MISKKTLNLNDGSILGCLIISIDNGGAFFIIDEKHPEGANSCASSKPVESYLTTISTVM